VALTLPPSLRTERHSVEDQVVDTRDLPAEQRLHWLAMACRISVKLARPRPDAKRLLTWRDEVPDSTRTGVQRRGVPAWAGR
jgi:hypothetical protein